MARTIDLRKPQKVVATVDPTGLATEAKQDDIIAELQSGGTGAVTKVTASVTSVTLKAANTSRKEVVIYNSSAKTLWVFYGTPAVASQGIPLFRNERLIEDVYNGLITGIWETGATGFATITEVT